MNSRITNLAGVMTDSDGNRYIPEPFTYAIDFNGITGAPNQASGQIQIQSDAAFVIQEQTFAFWDVTDPFLAQSLILVPNMFVLVTDAGSARKLMNQPIQLNQLFGDGRLPYVLPTQKYLSPSSALQVQVNWPTSFAAETYNLQLSFIGEKRYYLSN